MQPARSLLFIPGNRESWIDSAHENGAGVVILDLEDSVPPEENDKPRELVGDRITDMVDRASVSSSVSTATPTIPRTPPPTT